LVALNLAGTAHAASTEPADPIDATGQGQLTIVLHVINYAALPRNVLDETKARVASVYTVIGVRIVWVESQRSADQPQDGRLHLSMPLLSRDMAEKKISAEGLKDGVLGQSHHPSGRASIFCDRIATMPGAPTYFPIPLGDVIAQEAGHLVLGKNSHSPSGIMRAHTNVHTIHLQTFDEAQAQTIRKVLSKLAVTTGR
jgi:hypothetical protein